MSEMKWAIITGADGGMGTEITRAISTACASETVIFKSILLSSEESGGCS